MNKIKAYSYVRFSTDAQKLNTSLQRQLGLSQAYAVQHNLELITEYQDLGISGYKGKQNANALGRLKDAIAAGVITPGSYILVEEFDRLSRQEPMLANEQFYQLLKSGMIIVTLSDNQVFSHESVTENPMQLLMAMFKSIGAHDESKKKSERGLKTWNIKFQNINNKILTTKVPKWFTFNASTNKFELNDLAIGIKKIFEMSLAGNGSFVITRHLNEHKYTPPNAAGWYKGYIQTVFDSKAAYGSYKTARMDVETPDYFPAVITKEEFELNQALLQKRKQSGGGRKGVGFPNLFTKLICCGHCESVVIFRGRGSKDDGNAFLRCDNAERKKDCTAPSWTYPEFETAFLKYVNEVDFNKIFDNNSINEQQQLMNEQILLEAELNRHQQEFDLLIERFATAPDNLFKALEKSAKNKQNTILQFEKDLKELKHKILLIKPLEKDLATAENLKKYDDLIVGKTAEEIEEIRIQLHNNIKQIISYIVLYNITKFIPGDDLSSELEAICVKRGYKTYEQQCDYLMTDFGARLYTQYNRHFSITFANGVTKTVFNGFSIKNDISIKLEHKLSGSRSSAT